jgi:hypothetical protein
MPRLFRLKPEIAHAEIERKFRAASLGGAIGLLHDLGKYSREYQAYIAGP